MLKGCNQTGAGDATYTYDLADRMTSASTPGAGSAVEVEFNVRPLWFFPIYFGSVRVTDESAGVDVTVPIWFGQVTADGANGASGSSNFFGLLNLDWSVLDNGAGNDEVSLSLSGGVDYAAAGTIADGDLQVASAGDFVSGVTGSAPLGDGSSAGNVDYNYDGDGN